MTMPLMKNKKAKSHRRLYVVSKDAPFPFVEAYKSLRTNLEFLASTGSCKTVMVTSSVPSEGKSNVAINLAATLAASGKRVVLVDCDLRKASITHYLHIPRSHGGLSNLIVDGDKMNLTAALIRFKDLNITVMPVGPIPPNPAEMLSAPAMQTVFDTLKGVFDYIIVDTPPVSVVTDAAVLSRMVDGAILVVRPGVTTIQGAQLSKKNLQAVNTRILGVVMNDYDIRHANKKDGYYYSYSYGYYNHEEEQPEQDETV